MMSAMRKMRIIIFLRNERLFITFLVLPICHIVLPHYCAILLKEMSFNFTVYINIYIYIYIYIY